MFSFSPVAIFTRGSLHRQTLRILAAARCAAGSGERERERETRSIVGDKAKCGPCDSENWNVRTGAKPRHVSIRSQPGFPLNPAAFNRPTRLNFHRRWLRHLRLESVLNNYFYLPPTMTYRRGTRFPPPLLSCYSSKILSDKKTRHLERNARIIFFE